MMWKKGIALLFVCPWSSGVRVSPEGYADRGQEAVHAFPHSHGLERPSALSGLALEDYEPVAEVVDHHDIVLDYQCRLLVLGHEGAYGL